MPLTIYNSQTRHKEIFTSINPREVRMYVCGVTVYDDAHIGHARCYVVFDVIHRHFLARGFRVIYVRNFTDMDDKIIYKAAQQGTTCNELTTYYIESFSKDMAILGVLAPTIEPKVTEHMPEIIDQVQKLITRGHAYVLTNGDVYFIVKSFSAYGKLSGRTSEKMIAGIRVKVDERKQDFMDFALWKASKPHEPAWNSPWGLGRPGWHIECSAMSQKYLGITFDIHGGGKDLLFPHHENEIAQAEAASGEPFVHYWIHSGLVRINSEKMSKSLGNFSTIKDILNIVHPEALRLLFLSKHYRSPLDFNSQVLKEAATGLKRLYTALLIANEVPDSTATINFACSQEIEKAVINFEQAMDDDFNTAMAISSLFDLARISNRLATNLISPSCNAGLKLCAIRLKELGERLGLLRETPQDFLKGYTEQTIQNNDSSTQYLNSTWINQQINARQTARKDKNFVEADRIRDKLIALGIILEDTPQGTRWRIKNK